MTRHIAFDLDDTLYDDPGLGSQLLRSNPQPYPEVVEFIRAKFNEGWRITFFSARHWNCLEYFEQYMSRWDIPYHQIILGKPTYDYFVDDKAFNSLQQLKERLGEV